MLFYISIILITTLFLYFGVYGNVSIKLGSIQITEWLTFLGLLIIILVSGLRFCVGIDFLSYWDMFLSVDYTNTEFGFKCLIWIMKWLGLGPQAMYLITSVFVIVPVFYAIKFYTNDHIVIAFFIFLASGVYFESFNLIRQYLAIALFFYASRFIIERRFIRYLTFILIAALFHRSAIILLPFYWLLNVKLNVRVFTYVILGTVIITWFFPLKDLLEHIPYYGDYLSLYRNANPSGELGLGFLSKFVLALLSLFFANKLVNSDMKNELIIRAFTFSIIFSILFKDYIVFLRISYYFNIFIVVLLPLFLKIVTKKSKSWIYVLIISYCALLFIANVKPHSAKIIPYHYSLDFKTNVSPYFLEEK